VGKMPLSSQEKTKKTAVKKLGTQGRFLGKNRGNRRRENFLNQKKYTKKKNIGGLIRNGEGERTGM